MCFWKSKQSKVLRAKRDIVVYKIGVYADEGIFNPFFYQEFEYSVNQIMFTEVKFADTIDWGFHSYINCELVSSYNKVNLYSCGKLILWVPLLTVYLGEFIIPKGATYCLNKYGEVVSDKLIYTGNHIEITSDKIYNSKELWKENKVKYLLVMVKPIR